MPADSLSSLPPPAPSARAVSACAALVRRPALAMLVLAVAVFTAYSPSLNGDFLWDDLALVRGNLLIRTPLFCLEAFRHNLFDGNSNFYRPVQTLLFILDYWAWGLEPFGYHLASVVIHAINAGLLFLVLRGVLAAVFRRAIPSAADAVGAFWIALVWAVHPVHSAAVAYISGSADSLAMAFCLLAWLACEAAFRAGARRGRVAAATGAALLCFVLGLCSKEIANIWLALFLGYLFGVRADLPRRAKLGVLGGGLLAIGFYLTLRHLPPAPPPMPAYPPLPSRWLLMIRALGDYGSLMLFPNQLFMERQVFAAPGLANPADDSVYLALGAAGVAMLVAFAAGAAWPGRGRTLRRLGAGWFLLAFLPISNLFTLNASVAEHWLYLPSIGFLLFLAGVAVDLSWRGMRLSAGVASAVALVAVIGLSARTYRRSFDWMDELTFFHQTIADGGDVPRARLGLANSLSHQQNDAAAIPLLRRVATQYPRVISARINLANALARVGQLPEARAILEKAAGDLLLGNDPRQITVAVNSLDRLDDSPGWPERRRALVAEAVRRYPDAWDLVQLRLKDDERTGSLADAVALVAPYAQAHWWHAPSRVALGDLYSQLKRHPEAIAAWLDAARLDVHDASAYAAVAELCASDNRLEEACAYQLYAVRRQPSSPKQRAVYAEWLSRSGKAAAAAEQLAMANRLLAEGRKDAAVR